MSARLIIMLITVGLGVLLYFGELVLIKCLDGLNEVDEPSDVARTDGAITASSRKRAGSAVVGT